MISGHNAYVILHCLESTGLLLKSLSETESGILEEEKRIRRKKLTRRILDEESNGLFYAKVAYGDGSSEFDVFRRLYDAFSDADIDDDNLYIEVQRGIAKLIESDSVP